MAGIYEILAVQVVFFNSRGDSKNIWIKYNVFRCKANGVHKNFIRTRTYLFLAGKRVCLTLFIKCHDNNSGAVASADSCLFYKLGFPGFKRNRIDDGLALQALQTSFNNLPFGRIHHDRHTADIRLRRDQIQKFDHRSL